MTSQFRVNVYWEGYSGYAHSCWRACSQLEQMQLSVICVAPPESSHTAFDYSFSSESYLDVVPEQQLSIRIRKGVETHAPSIAMISGWNRKVFRKVARYLRNQGCKLVLALDNPWKGTYRQWLGTWMLRPYINNFSAAFVPGERAYQFARRIGFDNRPIFKGLYGVDSDVADEAYRIRASSGVWPKRFLFTGRLVKAKDIATLVKGYRLYRNMVIDPWRLSIVGQGPEKIHLQGVEGIDYLGFKQPEEMRLVWASHGAFVISSQHDPWPLVIPEAALSGLPIIHSEACGSSVEIVRANYNGYSFPAESPSELAKCFIKAHSQYDVLPTFGERSRQLAHSYSNVQCAQNWLQSFRAVLENPLA